jgi:hypothetical protein
MVVSSSIEKRVEQIYMGVAWNDKDPPRTTLLLLPRPENTAIDFKIWDFAGQVQHLCTFPPSKC